ncbi:hypothetical protein VTI74DRAFT_2961 [Chaetomium olivicolor]
MPWVLVSLRLRSSLEYVLLSWRGGFLLLARLPPLILDFGPWFLIFRLCFWQIRL